MNKNKIEKSLTNIPDYTGDARAAFVLAKKIQTYYASRGYSNVKCWAEPQISKRTGKKIWGVQSNIIFKVP